MDKRRLNHAASVRCAPCFDRDGTRQRGGFFPAVVEHRRRLFLLGIMAKQRAHVDIETELQFPLQGLEETRSFSRQRPGTSVAELNVRAFDPVTGRARGGSRPGLSRWFPKPITSYPIQSIDFLQTTDAPPPAAATFGQFTYALASGSGFGLGNDATGASIATGGAAAGFAYACSTWDTFGNCYICECNTTTGVVNLYCVTLAGVVTWSNLAIFSVATGSLRNVAGMAWVTLANQQGLPATTQFGQLFIAVTPQTGTAYIHQVTVAPTNFVALTLAWQAYNASTQALNFSTNSHNCLAAIAGTLGVESVGNGSNQGFRTYNAYATTGAAALSYTPWGATASNAFSRVISDGTNYFYTIASVTVNQVRQVTLGGAISWSSTAGDTATGLALDASTQTLLCTSTTTKSVRSLSLTAGSLLASSDVGAITRWDDIASDGQGTFVVWENAANKIAGINKTLSLVWGPTAFAGSSHVAGSLNMGSGQPVQISPANRQIRNLVVSNGSVYNVRTDLSPPTSVLVTNGAAYNAVAPAIYGAQSGNDFYYVDGAVYKYYQSSTNSILPWVATSGTMPADAMGRKARLIERWRARLVLFGLLGQSNLYFMTAVGQPTNFNYGVVPATQTMAFAGTVTAGGLTGDAIMTGIPYTDDTFIFGCAHSIWAMQGDPAAGGAIALVSDEIGMPFGRPWCKDPAGQIYFLSTRAGIWKLTPGALPVRASQQIDKRLQATDLSKNIVNLAWDVQNQGLAVFITPYSPNTPQPAIVGWQSPKPAAGSVAALVQGSVGVPGATINYFWEERTNAWHPDAFARTAFNPFAVRALDGDSPIQRRLLLGGQDGVVRFIDSTLVRDDGYPINSFVVIGPLTSKQFDSILLKALQARLDEFSGGVMYNVYVGNTAHQALLTPPVFNGAWLPGHNGTTDVRWKGTAVYVAIYSSSMWALESIRAVYQTMGEVERRQ